MFSSVNPQRLWTGLGCLIILPTGRIPHNTLVIFIKTDQSLVWLRHFDLRWKIVMPFSGTIQKTHPHLQYSRYMYVTVCVCVCVCAHFHSCMHVYVNNYVSYNFYFYANYFIMHARAHTHMHTQVHTHTHTHTQNYGYLYQ